jgi:hypothetical protein
MGIFQKLSVIFSGPEKEVAPRQELHETERVVAFPGTVQVNAPLQSPSLESGAPEIAAPPEQKTAPKVGVKKVLLDEAGLSILDLRDLPSSRFRIVGSGFWVTDSGRHKHGGNEYLLVREPKNKWDANAVAVYGKGRKVGHLSEAKAAALAPILDELGFDAYRVGGTAPAPNSIQMWVDIPAIPKLRAFAKTVSNDRA